MGVPKKLFEPLQLGGDAAYAQAGAYSVPASKLIDGLEFLLVNTTNAERTASIRIGSASSARYQLVQDVRIPARDEVPLSFRQVLPAGNRIYARASADNAVTLHLSGLEEDAAGAVPKRLWAAQLLGAALGSLYTVSNGKKLINVELVLCNTSGAARTVSLYATPSGRGSGQDASSWGKQIALPPKDTVVLSLRQVLDAGDKLEALADQAAAVAIHASGYVISP